jgi:hypothetical protein
MKTKFTLITLFISVYSYATVRTVNNNNPSPGQFSTFAAAHTAAVAGDTLYISGSPTIYSGNITKQLTVIGTGHAPDKQNPLTCFFTTINCNAGSAGSKFIGLTFNGNVNNLQNATYEHCKFNAIVITGAASLTTTFNKCVFTSAALSTNFASNTFIFNNCIFNNAIEVNGSTGVKAGSATNCLFLGNAILGVGPNFSGFTFSNNIFYGVSPQITAGTNTATTMTNNISFNCPNNNFNGTTLSGNIVNSNPLFTTYVPPGFHSTDNYSLQAGSPGHNAGTDGKDIGLYGGATGVNFHMGGEPSIAQIRQVNMPATVAAGQTINVNIVSTIKQ